MKKRIFITGIAGFIGFHLARKLVLNGNVIAGIDNFNDYYTPELKRKRQTLLQREKIEVHEGDICDFTTLSNLISEFKPTHFVHLAAQAGVRYSLVNPQAYVKANLEGFVNILEACRTFQLPLFYASSSSVYGRNEKIPFDIQDRTDSQANLYGVTKKTNELMADTYHHLYGIPVCGFRFFTVYGPWGRPDMAYYSFTKAIAEGKTIDVFHQGNAKRDFTYIDDIVDGIIAAIKLQPKNELFNLGNNQPASVLELITAIENALQKKAKMRFLPSQLGDIETTYADISYSSAKLGFQPKTSLQIGITQFVKWYLDNAKF